MKKMLKTIMMKIINPIKTYYVENQINLTLEPNAHKYSDDEGRVYTSVTTLIGKYQEPFNQRYWSMYTTLRDAGFKVRPTNGLQSIVVDNQYRSLDSLYRNPINCHEVNLLVEKWKKITIDACDRGQSIHDYLGNFSKKPSDLE